MPKLTYEKVINSPEHKLWVELNRVLEDYDLTDDTYFKMDDCSGVWWEPLLDRLYKLGSLMKVTKKLKEIKMDWMRPVLYFKAQSNGTIRFDGRVDIVDKGAVADATLVRYAFKTVINVVRSVTTLDEKNFKQIYKDFKKEIKYYFKVLAKYVKTGFRPMHEHVKLILYPLRMLRKSGYRLFSLERQEENYFDLNIFKDDKALGEFVHTTTDFFKWEKFKQNKDTEMLDDFIKKPINANHYEYVWHNTIRKLPESNAYQTSMGFNKTAQIKVSPKPTPKKGFNASTLPKIKSKKARDEEEKLRLEELQMKRKLMLPNIDDLKLKEPTVLKHEAYQLKFEEGISLMIEYLNSKMGDKFPSFIDSHKIFVNLKFVPNGRKNNSTDYYLGQLYNKVEDLKIKCYEMKLNGLSRVLMPITLNTEIIDILKDIYDLHEIIDNVMGNYLLHEQYIFIYDAIKFLKQSTVDDQIEKLRNRNYMEEVIPKYVVFQSMCRSASILNKMRKYLKEEELRTFKNSDSYQITEHDLDNTDNEMIYAYELNETQKRFFNEELQEKQKRLNAEINKFGRYWIFEGFFNKEDKQMWVDAIEILSQVDGLVQEDIRDEILYPKTEIDLQNDTSSSNDLKKLSSKNLKNLSRQQSANRNKKLSRKGSKMGINLMSKDKKRTTKRKLSKKYSLSTISNDFKMPNNLQVLRPPSVWHFPIHRLEAIKNKKIISEGGTVITEIRNVDPNVCYVDKRIEKFKEIFDKIFTNMKKYWNREGKPDKWDYFFNKILKALNISYTSYKVQKAEEELRKRIEEEERKKREEEERKERELMEKLHQEEEERLAKEKIEEEMNAQEAEKELQLLEAKVTEENKKTEEGKEASRKSGKKPTRKGKKNTNKIVLDAGKKEDEKVN